MIHLGRLFGQQPPHELAPRVVVAIKARDAALRDLDSAIAEAARLKDSMLTDYATAERVRRTR